MLKYFIISIIFIAYLVGFFYFLPAKLIIYDINDLKDSSPANNQDINKPPAASVIEKEDIGSSSEEVLAEEVAAADNNASSTAEIAFVVKDVLLADVPFTPQAPFGEWNNPIFQDGCEEAAMLMAIRWAKGDDGFTKEEVKSEILKLAEYQKNKYGEYRDTSAEDTVIRIIQGYFGYSQAEVKKDITTRDIINELVKGNLVITPMNGQRLNNPHYTPPGPERHMLVIRGYDSKTKEFITNDPGTRLGEKYRYKEDVLYDAIRNYSTGYHLPIEEEEKVMIVVKK